MKYLLLALSLGSAALATGQQKTAQTVRACSPADIQAGYVAVSASPACTGSGDPLSFNTIRVDTMPPGAVVRACGTLSQPLPGGWATLSWGPVVASNGDYSAYARTIENLNGLPAGTQVGICPGGAVPAGWTVLSRGGAACGTVGTTTFHADLIRKD